MIHDLSLSPRYTPLRTTIALSTLVLVLLFHHFLAKFPYGFSFTLFVCGLILAIHTILIATKTLTNRWAYLFLIPALLAAVSESLHASIAIRLLAPPVTALSLAFFAYWSSALPHQLRALPSLWPKSFTLDTFLPFSQFKFLFKPSERFSGRQASQIAFGLFLAIPALLLFIALFRSADGFFSQTINQWFQFDHLPERLGRYFIDLLFGIFSLGFLWTMALRSVHPYSILFRPIKPVLEEYVTLNTFLIMVNLLFFVFIGFQFIYLFQGQDYIASHGVTYASYARQGFFQLLAVAALVFILTWIVYRLTNMRSIGPRILNALLVGQTAVIILSALKRLWMYTQMYGFTVSRWWGIAGAILVGILLGMCFVGIIRKIHISSMMKWMAFVSLFFISLTLIPNSEGSVTRMNTQRFLAGKMEQLDYGYLTELSSDVLETLADFSKRPWPSEKINAMKQQGVVQDNGTTQYINYRYDSLCYQPNGAYLADRPCLQKILKARQEELLNQTTKDWRPGTVADYRALNALTNI